MNSIQKNKLNLVLLALIGIIIIVILYPKNQKSALDTLLSQTTPEMVEKIFIEIGENKYHLNKDENDQWFYVEPLFVAAINSRIKKLLKILNTPYLRKYPQRSINKKELGLQPPKATLTINNESFYFGNTEAISKSRFVLYQDHVYLIADRIYPLLDSRTQGLADTRLLKQGFDATQLKTPYSLNDQNIIKNWTNKQALGVEKLGVKKPLANLSIANANQIITFNILQFEPLFILNPQGKNVQYLLASDDVPLLLGGCPRIDTYCGKAKFTHFPDNFR